LPGDIFVSGFDLSVETVEAIREGYVGLVHDQQPYLQGYLSVLQICLAKTYCFKGVIIKPYTIEKMGYTLKEVISGYHDS